MELIKVMIVDDHTIVREGVRTMIEFDDGLKVVGEADNGRQAVEMAQSLKPDVILMDIAMAGLNGLEATRQILKAQPAIKVLMLSAHNDDAYGVKAIEVGAVGLLLKQASSSDVCLAIRGAMKGKHYYSPGLVKIIKTPQSGKLVPVNQLSDNPHHLTSREMEVLQLIAEGKANKQTASELGISIKTVEKHRSTLMQKLNIHDTAGLTRFAIGRGIIESSVQDTFSK